VKKALVLIALWVLPAYGADYTIDMNGNGVWDFLDQVIYEAIPEGGVLAVENLARNLQEFTKAGNNQSLAYQSMSRAQESSQCILSIYGGDVGGKILTAIAGTMRMHPEIAEKFVRSEQLIVGQPIPYNEDPSTWRELYCPESLKKPHVPSFR